MANNVIINDADTLTIQVETQRLYLKSIEQNDFKESLGLYSHAVVMKKFAEGVPFSENQIKMSFNNALEKWGSHDPFTQYKVINKSSDDFMGIFEFDVVSPGVLMVSYLFHEKYWGKGYGKEAMTAAFDTLLPKLAQRKYKACGKQMFKIVATARLDNPASQHILKSVGFKEEEIILKHGALRHSYSLKVDDLKNTCSQQFFKGEHHKKDGVCSKKMELASSKKASRPCCTIQ